MPTYYSTTALITTIFITFSSFIHSSAAASYNVLAFGAVPTGLADSTQAFASAWTAACQTSNKSLIYVPKGRYLLTPVVFSGDNCAHNNTQVVFRIDGTLIAPSDHNVLGASADWIRFQRVDQVSIVGGALDAKGGSLWDCKAAANTSTSCIQGATVGETIFADQVLS
uniref:Rhamnogalacturonase A/B/Epimerase-like pectate lyase domain-containing protein n=1 Tax=Kalanchoe fedtschenkoi TaxID=63787 RepID=A0A7N0ZXF5_KALFE